MISWWKWHCFEGIALDVLVRPYEGVRSSCCMNAVQNSERNDKMASLQVWCLGWIHVGDC